MKKLFIFVAVLAFTATITVSDSRPDTAPIITLLYMAGAGHACPCEGKVYTARHIVLDREGVENAFAWQDGLGNSGTAEAKNVDAYRDLGEIKLKSGGRPLWYPMATEAPKVGDMVYWQEFDSYKFPLSVNRSAKVVYTVAGYVFFSELPNPGASGSCLLNQYGQVVGIVVWGIRSNGTGGASLLVWDRR